MKKDIKIKIKNSLEIWEGGKKETKTALRQK